MRTFDEMLSKQLKDEEFRKEAEQFAINLKNGSIDRMFKEFDKKAKEQ